MPLVQIMDHIGPRIPWITCPNIKADGKPCGLEWNSLVRLEEPGQDPREICAGCFDDEAEAARRQVANADLLIKAIGHYGLEQFRFDNFDEAPDNALAFQAAKTFDPARHNLFLWGHCGRGKTHLAGAILKKMCGQNRRVQWLTPLRIEWKLKGAFPSEEQAILDGIAQAEVLFIDDLGIGRDLNMVLRALYHIMDRRKAMKRNGLVITSNESIPKLAAAYKDDRIMSRMTGLCDTIVEIRGTEDGRLAGRGFDGRD